MLRPTMYAFLIFAMSLLLQACEPPACPTTWDNSRALDTITEAQAQYLQENFRAWASTSQYRDDVTNLPEITDHVWFSLEKIQDLMEYAHYHNCQNTSSNQISGFRVYFGRYGDKMPANGVIPAGFSTPSEPNRLTVFISPTVVVNAQGTNHADLGYGVFNYGHAGEPPRKDYPH